MTPDQYETACRACRIAAHPYARGNGALCRSADLEAAAMLRIVESAERFRPERGSWGAWCTVVAQRGVLDYIRSVRQTQGGHQHRVVTEAEGVDTEGSWAVLLSPLDLAADPDPQPDHQTDYQLALDALDRLEDQDARVLGLYYLSGYTDREIAEQTPRTYAPGPKADRLTVSSAAIHARRMRGLSALQSLFKN